MSLISIIHTGIVFFIDVVSAPTILFISRNKEQTMMLPVLVFTATFPLQTVPSMVDSKIGLTQKHLTLLSCPIGTFLEEYYLPALDAYAYHQPHFQILGKSECGALRHLAFLSKAQNIKTIWDYSEWLNAAFDQEIQSDQSRAVLWKWW
jgi:hypothetical protein